MKVKMFEIRDDATFIPAIAIEMGPTTRNTAEAWLLRRAGYGETRCILLARADGGSEANYDPYAWPNRTMHGAHLFIEENWDTLLSGDVVDARVGLGERSVPVASERGEFP